MVEEFHYKEWAEKNDLTVGDIILSVDNIDINDLEKVKMDSSIRAAKVLTVQKADGHIEVLNIKPFDIPNQIYIHFIFPILYFLLTLYLALYLYRNKKKTSSLNILVIFMLTVSLAYISGGASSRLNNIGVLVNGCCMLLCLVLLIHFLKHYFIFLKIKWIFSRDIRVLYLSPLISVFCSLVGVINPEFLAIRTLVTLFLFIFLLIVTLYILIRGYYIYKVPQLKVLFIGIVIPFLPFLSLFALPEIFFHKHFLPAEISAMFLLFIPFSFLFTQLTERIFDMEYYITRLRYYASFSFVFTVWLVIGLHLVTGSLFSTRKILEISFFIFLSLIALLYIKEKVDYHKRKVLFSTKGDYIHQLYTTVDKIGKTIKIDDLLNKFSKEVMLHLELEYINVLTFDYLSQQFTLIAEPTNYIHNDLDVGLIEKLRLGEIQKMDSYYLAFIHQDTRYKRVLVLGHNKSINLKDEELLWLELLLLYLNNFIDNTKMIEGLIEELKQVKQADGNQLPWLNKLLWLRFEEEKYQLAQELHDTNLQEQLHIAREVDVLIHAKDPTDIQSKLAKVHEQMIASVHELRAYCENLKPPLLDTLGLNAALEKLILKVITRANFKLIYTIDRLYLEDERLNLMIYRLFQELLNNALKHSKAASVEIHLTEMMDGFEVTYSDDGVGCNLDDIMLSDSMGIKGMQERVTAFNGQFHIESHLSKGMCIKITVEEGSDTLDFSAHSG
ncbi:sensor histidine kinase [Lysinibacillus sp. NPDC096418]|uniref:sensor histidine kinase n=1 Tax=Lysinibacillus sp. NPDC096418 TaxID=3364138 RepID=UPI0037FE00C3